MTVYPVLQAFEKDQTKIIFAINQLARGLSVGGGGVPANMREPLTANRTYFVATTGSDTNNGLTAGASFLTVQRAIDAAYGEIDLKGFDVTIQLANGTYTGPNQVLFPQIGAGTITINGDSTNAANVTIQCTGVGQVCLLAQRFSTVLVANLTLTSTGAGSNLCLFASQTGLILGNSAAYPPGTLIFGTSGNGHIAAGTNGQVDLLGAPYQITGNATNHLYSSFNGIVRTVGSTCTIATNRAFTQFANANNLAFIQAFSMTFTGAGVAGTTGKRYDATFNAVIQTNGGNLFPSGGGPSFPCTPGAPGLGTTSTGGQFG